MLGMYHGDMEIRDAGVHRSFADPKARRLRRCIDRNGNEVPDRSMRAMYGSCSTPVILRYDSDVDHEWHVRCRNCPGCIRARRYLWSMRCQAETLVADRTWMFTGTWAEQTDDYQAVKEETTLWLKRLREHAHRNGAGRVRYFIAPERHKSGKFHIHALVHGSERLSYRMVRDTWHAGFTVVKLADVLAAGYVTKYVTKDLFDESVAKRPRIRASRANARTGEVTYGAWVMERDAQIVQELMAQKPEEDLVELWQKNLNQAVRELKGKQKVTPESQLMALLG